jgi:lipoate-protein ligase B
VGSTPEPPAGAEELTAVWLGRRDFASTQRAQLDARDALIAGEGSPVLFLVEHPPTLTLGRRARREHILWSDEQLAAAGMAVCETPRGGEVTLHAPGQLVAYPIVKVGRRIREHIVRMAETSIELLAGLGLEGTEFRMEHPGVWLEDRKLGSIGIHVSRGVTVQGLSLNVDVEPMLFSALVSCGLEGTEVTSAASFVDAPVPPLDELARAWGEGFARRANMRLRWVEPAQLAL